MSNICVQIGPESHFGLFRNDQSPKPAAKALHFLSELLRDTGSGGTSSLTFSLKGLPVGGEYLLFEKSDGTFILVVWNNAPVYNPLTKSDIYTASVQVTLQLSGLTTVNIYDIYDANANDTAPLAPISMVTGTGVTFSMSDKAVVFQFAAPSGGDGSTSSATNSGSGLKSGMRMATMIDTLNSFFMSSLL